jgi:hypothetical protein
MKYSINTFVKKLTLLFTASALLLGAQVAFAAGAREYENPPCYDITGTTTAVMVGGVNNGGIMDFDDAGVDAEYQACVRMSSLAADAVPVRLEGWVWNDNLAWVSLYCPGGMLGGMNLDIACGTQAYSITFSTTGTAPDLFTNVAMSGYAWGDNVGWITFDTAFSQIEPIPSGASRGLVNPASPAAETHAWADSVGWLDFSGVRFWWEDSDPFVMNPDVLKYVSVCSDDDLLAPVPVGSPKCGCDLDGTCPGLSFAAQIPEADNIDAYNVEVAFVDTAIPPEPNINLEICASGSVNMYATGSGKPYCYKVVLAWSDGVDMNQTTSESQSSQYDAVHTGAVRGKPFTESNLVYDPARVAFQKDVTSVAPTSDRNIMDGMQNELFHNFPDLAGYDPTLTNNNLLKLVELKLLFFKYSTGPGVNGECIYGDIVSGNCEIYDYMSAGGTTLSFDPLVEIFRLDNNVGGTPMSFISIPSVDVAQQFDIERSPDKSSPIGPVVDMFIGFVNNADYKFRLVDAPFPKEEFTDPGVYATKQLAVVPPETWLAQVFTTNPSAVVSDVSPYLYSKIHYDVGVDSITYWGAKLPRVSGGVLINPVAKVQGNVYVTDFAAKSKDVSLKSLGNISSNLRRETVTRNVAKYLTGYGGVTPGDGTVLAPGASPTITVPNMLVANKVYYVKEGDLTIDCAPALACTFDSNVTFIVENGSIFLDSNIETTGDAQVGLIALRNLVGNKQDEGFLYLDKEVTWLSNVHMYLDRVLQGYDKNSISIDANGFAKSAPAQDDYARQTTFINQLVFEGTMSAMNGIGNASRATPTDERGKEIVGGTYCDDYSILNDNICRARVVDLNYLRYYGPGLEICDGSAPGSVGGIPTDQALKNTGDTALGCNPNHPSYAIFGTELYNASTKPNMDLVPGASGGKRSEYFISEGSPVTLANEFPVNFFYTPISKDLAGFEVDQAFNPVLQR